MILGVVVTEVAGDALRFVARPDDPARSWALARRPRLAAARSRSAEQAAAAGFGIAAWLHIGFVMAFGTYLPYSKHLHILTSEPNVYLRNLEPRGALRKMDLEAEPPPGEELVFGAKSLKDLTWRHLLDGLSCTECGRCMEFCPASMTGKTLSPKHFMEGLRDQIVAAETALAAAAGAQRAARGGASTAGVEAADASLGLGPRAGGRGAGAAARRPRHPRGGGLAVHHLRLVRGGLPGADRARRQHRRDPPQPGPRGEPLPEGAERGIPQHGDGRQPVGPAAERPPRLGQGAGRAGARRRGDQRDVGRRRTAASSTGSAAPAPSTIATARWCAPWRRSSSRPRSRSRCSGPRETCTGDPARRAGNEYLFQMLAEENVATLTMAHDEHSVRTIVASCPHCFNTIRNEYPQFGLAGVEVIHHTQLLDTLVADGRLDPDQRNEAVVAYHDACYLGRYNEVYDEGRRVVESVPGQTVVEMEQHHRKGMCCGAGGARMWMEEREGQRINHRRTEQALATSPHGDRHRLPVLPGDAARRRDRSRPGRRPGPRRGRAAGRCHRRVDGRDAGPDARSRIPQDLALASTDPDRRVP